MSRATLALLGILGAVAGGYAGTPYLNDGAVCGGQRVLECQLNQVILPFLSAVTLGMVAALAIGAVAHRVSKYGLRGAPERSQTRRAAVEVDDPYLELASWGLAPRRRRKLPTVAQAADSRRQESEESERPQRPGRLGSRGRPVPRPRRVT